MKLHIKIDGKAAAQEQIHRLFDDHMRKAARDALNTAAFGVRKAMQDEMRRQFDRPTPFIVNSVRVKMASAAVLQATIEPVEQGGKSVAPQKILRAEVEGGPRRDKRSEVALRRVGILPSGYFTAIPRSPYPGSSDGRGNLKGSFLVTLLSYFEAFGEQGYRANSTAATRARRAKVGRSENGFKTINGVVFFVAYGRRLRSGPTEHLAPGIYAKTGIHGSNVRPVLMFVRGTNYTPRLSLKAILEQARPAQTFAENFAYRLSRELKA